MRRRLPSVLLDYKLFRHTKTNPSSSASARHSMMVTDCTDALDPEGGCFFSDPKISLMILSFFPSLVSYRFYCQLSSSLMDLKSLGPRPFLMKLSSVGGARGMTPENCHLIQHPGVGLLFQFSSSLDDSQMTLSEDDKKKINIYRHCEARVPCNPSQCKMLLYSRNKESQAVSNIQIKHRTRETLLIIQNFQLVQEFVNGPICKVLTETFYIHPELGLRGGS